MTCNIAQPGGATGQLFRNMQLEPLFGANSRSVEGSEDRRGEVAADKAAIALGGGVAATALATPLLTKLLPTPGKAMSVPLLGKIALGLTAGAGALFAAAGVANLNAKLDCGDDGKGGKDIPKGPQGPGPVDPGKNKPVTYSHTVVRGDTLTDIAECNDVSVENLYTYNQDLIGDNGNRIMPGMKLIIPPKGYEGPGAEFAPTAPRSLPKNECVAPIPGSALEPCV